jgi:acetylornithine deacetylase/succinyl-diaminopimelate desuccinylase-like protein
MIDTASLNRLVDLAIAIQQIPAPTFEEQSRASFVLERFRSEDLRDVSQDKTGNVFACLPGAGSARPVVVSAHLDTVFPLSTDLHINRSGVSAEGGAGVNQAGLPSMIGGPGIGDNSLGVASLFGLLWELRRSSGMAGGQILPGDVWLVANVGEEGLGNLGGMQAVVDRFGEQPLAYLVVEGMALGQIYNRGLGVQRYRIAVDTPGGHSWVDYGQPSAIHTLAQLVTRLTDLALPSKPRTTLNVGKIYGGTSINTIAAHAQLELDLRSESIQELASLAGQVEALVKQTGRPGVQATAQIIGQRPAGEISDRHPLVRLAVHTLQELGLPAHLNVGSTDANVPLSCGLPAICLGMTIGVGAHTLAETIEIPPIATGLQQLVRVVQGIFKLSQS